jgi:rubrerythrin
VDPAETLNSVSAIENLMLQIEVEEDGLKLFEQQLKITKEVY